jgi:WD40 repeat protein
MSGAGGAGRVIRLVEVETGKPKAELRGHLADVTSLAFTPEGQTLLSASEDGTIRVWDVLPRAKEKSVHEFSRNSISLAWRSYGPALCLSPDGRHLLTVYTNQTFSVWDTLRLAEGERHPLPFTNTTMAAVAPGGRLAAFGSRSGEVMLWDVGTGQARFYATGNESHSPAGFAGWPLPGYRRRRQDPSETTATSYDPKRTVRVWMWAARRETHVFSTDGEFPVH